MKRVNIPTKNMDQYAGKWVAIDSDNQRIVAVGETLKDKKKIRASAFLVPRKDEDPYSRNECHPLGFIYALSKYFMRCFEFKTFSRSVI